MGLNYLSASAVCTGVSLVGLLWRTGLELAEIESDGSIGDGGIHSGNAARVLELLLDSYFIIGLLANFVLNAFVLVILCFKTIFFTELYPSETRKVVENLVNYIIYKGTFLPLVIPPTVFQAALWSTWLTVICCLKMFQALGRDRLERLNASPSATPWTYFRVYSVFLVVLSVDILWIWLCVLIYRSLGSITFLLLFFEPFSVGFETFQAIMIYGFQLLDMWLRHLMEGNDDCHRSYTLDRSTAGSLRELKATLFCNLGFFLDVMSLLMAIGHYVQIWWLRGMAFQLVDAVLFLNLRALVSTIFKRIKGFVKLKQALYSLDGALPDATTEELHAYNDDCSICREAMARAKRLSCNHLFHLSCLRSWLDQGLSEVHACPTCRRPLLSAATGNSSNSRTEEPLNDEQGSRQLSMLDHPNSVLRHALPVGAGTNQRQNPTEASVWRGLGLDPGWVQPWPNPGFDGAGPSTAIRSVGLGRVQMVMRHLASVGDTYTHTTLEDTAWGLWPMGQPPAASGSSLPLQPSAVRYNGNTDGLRFRNTRSSTNGHVPGLLAMAEAVREVLPHIPDEIIFQDLQQTNNVTVTVNNLLQM